jgi:DNA-binding MarR family transcriptional regulator
VGLHKRFYPLGTKAKRPVGLEEQVLATLWRNPGMNQKEVSRWVGEDPVRTHRVIHRLAKAGVIRLRREGREIRCFLEEDGTGMEG